MYIDVDKHKRDNTNLSMNLVRYFFASISLVLSHDVREVGSSRMTLIGLLG